MGEESSQRELLAYLVARVAVLESTLEALVTYLPAIHADLVAASKVGPCANIELSMKLTQKYFESRTILLKSFGDNAKEQFPDYARLIDEHLLLAHKKIDENLDEEESGS
jgi:hypothetical protein